MLLLNGRILIVFVVICYLASCILARITNKDKKPVNWMREVIKFLFVLYLSMVVAVTLFPIIIGHNPNIQNEYRSLNFIPLVSIFRYFSQIGTAYDGDVEFMIELIAKNIGGNILLLMPLGFCAPILFNKFNSFKNVVLLGLFMSICIECIQFFELISGIVLWRSVDIDDVICNVIGAVLGYLIYTLLFRFENMKPEKFKM
ncbi:VanZ family protein [Bacillus sp. ISL-7]|uniref:VanZ family protein n=1 Tax=Bacillus sp. ISL-7 TaxID=2819136 RepID=UPI001BEC1193|nr:VanZ family protein [Bacillus sp. ISL-7]MBT2737980.1 VanZ family protein [Bacillus sp. ISL-7]